MQLWTGLGHEGDRPSLWRPRFHDSGHACGAGRARCTSANHLVRTAARAGGGRGAVGGYVTIPSTIGEEAAELALQVLDGKAVSSIPVTAGNSLRPVFDWPQMQKWGVDESNLPKGSEVRNRELSLWEQYPRQATTALVVVALQSAFIAAPNQWRWGVVRDGLVADRRALNLDLKINRAPDLPFLVVS